MAPPRTVDQRIKALLGAKIGQRFLDYAVEAGMARRNSRRRYYVPSAKPNPALVAAIGEPATRVLMSEFGGICIDLSVYSASIAPDTPTKTPIA